MVDVKKIAQNNLLVGGALVLGGLVVVKKVRDLLVNPGTQEEQQRALNLTKLPVSRTGLTISDTQAELIAQGLLDAMNGYFSSDEPIVKLLRNRTKDDLLLIIAKFGIKPYNGAGLATRKYEIKYFSVALNLIGWLKRELNGKEYDEAQQIFESAGIPF